MNGINKYQLENNLSLVMDDDTSICVIESKKGGHLKLDIVKGTHYVFINHLNKDTSIYSDDISVDGKGSLFLTYIGLSSGDLNQKTKVVVEEDCDLKLKTIYLTKTNKSVLLNCVNNGVNSNVDMDNSCVIVDDGNLFIDAIGKIVKGASKSSHFQKTRCLTIGDINKAMAKPSLLIDENDVKAGHSLTLGTIDKNKLFYLQSRGLSYSDSIKLLYESYLLLDLKYLNNKTYEEEILKMIKEQID